MNFRNSSRRAPPASTRISSAIVARNEWKEKVIKRNYFFISFTLTRRKDLKGGNGWRMLRGWTDDDFMLLIVCIIRLIPSENAWKKMIISKNKYRKVGICLRHHHHKRGKSFQKFPSGWWLRWELAKKFPSWIWKWIVSLMKFRSWCCFSVVSILTPRSHHA